MTIERLRAIRDKLRQLKSERYIVPETAIVDLAEILDEVLTEIGPSLHAQAVDAISKVKLEG